MHRSLRTVLLAAAAIAVLAAGSAGAAKLVTGQQIKNGSIGLTDLSKAAKRALHGAHGAAGAAGAPGPQGPTGPQGPAGPGSLNTTVRTKDFVAPPNDVAEGEVRCPPGMVAIGGGLSSELLIPIGDLPSSDGRGWTGSAFEVDGASGSSMRLAVVCTPGSAQVLPNGT